MKKINGKKVTTYLTFIDCNVSKEILQIKNPNSLLIPKLGDEIYLYLNNVGDENFTGDGDYTVKRIKKDYSFDKETKLYYMTIFVEVI